MAAASFDSAAEEMLPAVAKHFTGMGACLCCSQRDRDTYSLYTSAGQAIEK